MDGIRTQAQRICKCIPWGRIASASHVSTVQVRALCRSTTTSWKECPPIVQRLDIPGRRSNGMRPSKQTNSAEIDYMLQPFLVFDSFGASNEALRTGRNWRSMPGTAVACAASLRSIVDSYVNASFSALFFVAASEAKLRRVNYDEIFAPTGSFVNPALRRLGANTDQ